MKKIKILACLSVILLANSSQAGVRLANIFNDHMVLQRNMKVPIWGTSAPGEKLTIKFNGQNHSFTADSKGKWQSKLSPMKAGGPYVMSVKGKKNTVTIKDILIGEVWFCAGQSNMYVRLRKKHILNAEKEIANADYPQIRSSFNNRKWLICSPKTVGGISAVSYFAAQKLHQALKVPVGIITLSAGGRALQTWLNKENFNSDPQNAEIVKLWKGLAQAKLRLAKKMTRWKQDVAKAKSQGVKAPRRPIIDNNYRAFLEPGGMYKYLQGVFGYGIRGIFWYQGESDAMRDWHQRYAHLFPQLIKEWRKSWKRPNLPFIFVQMPRMRTRKQDRFYRWAALRDVQLKTLALPNTQMAVTIDIEDNNLHSKNKRPVGERLALAALESVYKTGVKGISPTLASIEKRGSSLFLRFNNIGKGFAGSDSKINGFEVCGEQNKFVKAKVKFSKNGLLVWSPEVKEPKKVRYGWKDNPTCNLMSSAGLPLSPFGQRSVSYK